MRVPAIPEPAPEPFHGGISHPDLYLWDAWSYAEAGAMHLYTLAVNRRRTDGTPLAPADRNDIPFHVRHFRSTDRGESWTDQGCLIAPRSGAGLADSQTIWSGSIQPLQDGAKLFAYTGLRERGKTHPFVQAIMLALSDGFGMTHRAAEPLLCPLRDHAMIVAAGYHLAAPDDVGHCAGEDGGPVLAWRDPFVLLDEQDRIHIFWSAKVGPCEAAMGHALVTRTGNTFHLGALLPPIIMPDADCFTQFELPKIYRDAGSGLYYLIASTCNRIDEQQSDEEVDKRIRLYLSASLDGPWRPCGPDGSALPGLDHLFGMTVLEADFARGSLLCMAPYTVAAGRDLGLTFTSAFRIPAGPEPAGAGKCA